MRLGPPAAGPRGARVRRSARPGGVGAGRDRSRHLSGSAREGRRPAGGVRPFGARRRPTPPGGHGKPEPPDGGGGGVGDRARDPERVETGPVLPRGRLRRGRKRPPQVPLSRPPAAVDPGDVHETRGACPLRAGVLLRERFPRGRDAGADEEHPRGGAGLPGAVPRQSGDVLRPSPVPAAVQADPDDRRVRPVCADRQVLPRRGPARRPAARVHADRRRDVVHRPGRHLSHDGRAHGPRLPRRSRRGDPEPHTADELPGGDGPVRGRQARHPVRAGDHGPHGAPVEDRTSGSSPMWRRAAA